MYLKRDKERYKKARRMKKEGKKVLEIAERLDISERTVRNWTSDMSRKVNFYSPGKYGELRKRAFELSCQGLRPNRIAKILGVSHWFAKTHSMPIKVDNYDRIIDAIDGVYYDKNFDLFVTQKVLSKELQLCLACISKHLRKNQISFIFVRTNGRYQPIQKFYSIDEVFKKIPHFKRRRLVLEVIKKMKRPWDKDNLIMP